MIRFEREGSQVRCTVCIDVPNYEARDFWFRWEATSPAFAGLLSDRMEKEMRVELEKKMRRTAYEQGYKDAKAKRAKETWFTTGW